MKSKAILTTMALLVGLSALAAAKPDAKPDEGEKKKADTKLDEKAMQEAWAQTTQPGPAHERLKKLAGKWKTVMKKWQGPGEPTISYGIATYRLILRGRFVEEQLRMEMAGMPVEVRGLIGYDNIKQKYVAAWASKMETHLINMEGVYDEDKNAVTYTGNLVLPTGGVLAVRSVEREIDDNTRVTETYLTMPGGEEHKNMEMTYTRVIPQAQ